MNKKIFYFVLLIMSVTFFSACSDDDDPAPTISEEVAGTYKGDLNVKIPDMGAEQTTLQKIILSKSGEGQVKLELNDFAFSINGNTEILLGKIEVDNVPISKNGDTYNLAETSIEGYKLANGTITANIKVSGTIVGKKADLKIDVTEATAVGNVFVTFNGNKMDADNEKTEALIKSMTIDSKIVTAQPVVSDNNITFYISESASTEDLKALKPVFEISEGATIDPASGSTVDFSANNVTFMVTAEDGIHKTKYTVTWLNSQLYDFENWKKIGNYTDPTGWASCNIAVNFIIAVNDIDFNGPYPVNPTTDAKSGKSAIEMVSLDTKGGTIMGTTVPKITAATAYLGKFDMLAGLSGDALKTTKFGVEYAKKPLKVKGFYKYKAGEVFYDNETISTTEKDSLAISAVLYEIETTKESLDGHDIYTSDKIVAKKMFASAETKTEYTPFELVLDYEKEYDPAKKYKFAIILSSSKNGAAYKAAAGSTLIVDDIEVFAE